MLEEYHADFSTCMKECLLHSVQVEDFYLAKPRLKDPIESRANN